MIVRCAGCGTTVSEWAARCSRCGHDVADSIRHAREEFGDPANADDVEVAVSTGPRVVHGVVIGDAPPDPTSAVWSRAASARPVWERSGLPDLAEMDPASPTSVSEVPGAAGADEPEEPVEPVEPSRRRWPRIVGIVAAVGVLGAAGWVVARPHSDAASAHGDPWVLLPVDGRPEPRWTVDFESTSFTVARVGDVVVVASGPPSATTATIEALDIASGASRWRTDLESEDGYVGMTPAPDGIILSTGRAGPLVYLDALTGERRWEAERGGYVVGPRVEDRALVVVESDSGPMPDVALLDVRTGALEPVAGATWLSPFGRGVVLRDGDDLVAFDIGTARETGRWAVFPDLSADGEHAAAAVVGDTVVVAVDDRVTGIAPDGGEWSVDLRGSVGQMITLDRDRLLVVTYGRTIDLHLLEVRDGAAVLRWSEEANLANVLSSRVAIVVRDRNAVLVELGDDGLEDISDLGSLENGGIWGVMGDALLFRTEGAFTAVRADGSEVWAVEIDPQAIVWAVDGGFLAHLDGRLSFYG